MSTIRTRMGDGYVVELTPDELRADLEAGCADAVKRGKVPPLEEAEFDWLYELFAYKGRIVGVEAGHEVILTKDGSANTLNSAQLSSGVGLPLSREQCVRVVERAFCFDTMEIGHPDYSYKPVKPASPLNGSIESFNGKLRDELLNGELFSTLKEAQILIAQWSLEDNGLRPHSSLGGRPPAPEEIVWPGSSLADQAPPALARGPALALL